jgi:hypothetical protein
MDNARVRLINTIVIAADGEGNCAVFRYHGAAVIVAQKLPCLGSEIDDEVLLSGPSSKIEVAEGVGSRVGKGWIGVTGG